MQCDDAGRDVELVQKCLPEKEVCVAGECVLQFCEPGEVFCVDDFTAALCSEDGSGHTAQACSAQHYCDEGFCYPQVCPANEIYCDGDVYKVCDEKGSKVKFEEDCSLKGQHCHQGVCINTVCPPGEVFCYDSFSVGTCAEDGMEVTTMPCPPGHYCEDALCLAQVCTPDTAFCDLNVAKICDSKGSGVVNELDCGTKACVDGECVECQPDCTDKECGNDGCGGECGKCDQGQVCINGLCPPPGSECDDGNDVDWDGCTNGMLSEFRVNQWTADHQQPGDVAFSEEGVLLVTWTSESQFSNANEPVGRFMIPGEASVGLDKKLNSSSGWSTLNAIGCAQPGGFAIVWSNVGQDGDGFGLFGRLFLLDGAPATEEFQVNTNSTGDQALYALTCLSDGGFLVVWSTTTGPGSNPVHMLRGQWFTPDGAMAGDELQLAPGSGATGADAACASNNTCMLAWKQEDSEKPDHDEILHVPLAAYEINPGMPSQTNTWDSEALGGTSVSAIGETAFVVVWESWNQQDDAKTGLRAQLLTQDGMLTGDEFHVNTSVLGNQTNPRSASLADGTFLVVWSGDGNGGSGDDVYGQLFASTGDKQGEEFRLNLFQTGHQYGPRTAAVNSDEFVVIWRSAEQDSSGLGVYDRRINALGQPLHL